MHLLIQCKGIVAYWNTNLSQNDPEERRGLKRMLAIIDLSQDLVDVTNDIGSEVKVRVSRTTDQSAFDALTTHTFPMAATAVAQGILRRARSPADPVYFRL